MQGSGFRNAVQDAVLAGGVGRDQPQVRQMAEDAREVAEIGRCARQIGRDDENPLG